MTHRDPIALLASVYSSTAPAYDRLWSPVIQPMGERLVAAMPLRDAGSILDVGAGSGALLPAIRAAAPRAAIIAIDRAPGMLWRARGAAPGISLALMDAGALALRAAAVEAAVLAFVLFHFPDLVGGLREIRRVLRAGGLVGAATWGADQLLPRSDIWDAALDAAGAPAEDLPEAVRQHARVDHPDKVAALLRQAGLEPVRVWTERFERRWHWPDLFEVRAGYGVYRRRLDALAGAARRRCLDQVRERLAALEPEALVYRPEIVFALARRP